MRATVLALPASDSGWFFSRAKATIAAGSQWSPCEWVIRRWSIAAGVIPADSRPFRPVTE